jgi:hypothetical protein
MQVGNWTLVDKTTGIPVNKGDTITDFRGESHILHSASPPHKFGAAGYATVIYTGNDDREHHHQCYVSVYNLVWKDTTND